MLTMVDSVLYARVVIFTGGGARIKSQGGQPLFKLETAVPDTLITRLGFTYL